MKSQLTTPGTLLPTGSLRTAASESPRRWPWLMLAALIATVLAIPTWKAVSAPDSLEEVALVGDRGPGCIRLVVANDQSGSMTDFAVPREQALAQFLRWAPTNLRADDEIAVLAFTDHVKTVLEPISVTARPTVESLTIDGQDTLFAPVISAISQLPATACSTALVLLSDGVMSDLSGDAETARGQLRTAGVNEVFLLVPGESIDVAPGWTQTYPYAAPVRFNGTDPAETGLVFGQTLASMTGQNLEKTS
ncbi:hypothetical protein [Nocardia farcinica]|uniref:hypothetical protein n=1 Tax=Nocardia farcinica TaxID=37329 RepID=UPI002455168B|nr:hypothetical protein [Nocardia farcinica]